MTQTFTMAFTAKCAECSVCARGTACNLSGLFYILYKESASPCFSRCCSRSVFEEKREMSTAVQAGSSSTFYRREETFLSKRVSFVAWGYSRVRCVPLRGVPVVFECWQQRYGTLQQWVHWQAADKQGGSACHARAGRNWWPHPTQLPVYLCRGQACVTVKEYLACLNKLRFAHWLMEN